MDGSEGLARMKATARRDGGDGFRHTVQVRDHQLTRRRAAARGRRRHRPRARRSCSP